MDIFCSLARDYPIVFTNEEQRPRLFHRPPPFGFSFCLCVSLSFFSRSQLHCFAGYRSVCVCLTPSVFQVRPRYVLLAGRRPRQCCVLISGWWGVHGTLCPITISLILGLRLVSRGLLYTLLPRNLYPILCHPVVILPLQKNDFQCLSFLLQLLVGVLLSRKTFPFSPLLPHSF